jgi:hypothetical protein
VGILFFSRGGLGKKSIIVTLVFLFLVFSYFSSYCFFVLFALSLPFHFFLRVLSLFSIACGNLSRHELTFITMFVTLDS